MTRYNRNTLIVGLAAALVVGGVVSYFASPHPDGLEKTQEKIGSEAKYKGVEPPAVVFEEYSLKWFGGGFWGNAAAGVVGSLLVLAVVLVVGRVLGRGKAPGAGEPISGPESRSSD